MASRSYTGLAVPRKRPMEFGSKSATALAEEEEEEDAVPPMKADWRDKRRGTIMRDTSWKKIQERTFTTWFNDRLRGNLKVAAVQVENLETDLKNGILLIELLNKLAAPEKISHYSRNPRMKVHCLENLGIALSFIRSQNIKLVNMRPEEIYDGNLKLILGLIWTLISRYQIKVGHGLSAKKAMLGWINTVIPEYLIANFCTDWNDGRAVCGMVDRIRPGTCPNHYALDRSRGLENCTLGMNLAEQHLSIPKILSPEDLNNPAVDDLSVMTYLSYFCDPFNRQLLEWIRRKIPERNIKNLSTDWNDGVNLGALVEACFPGVCPDWKTMNPAFGLQNLEKLIKLVQDRLGVECPVTAGELADPKVDEIIVATYLSHFRNAKLRASPEEFSLRVPTLPHGVGIIREPVVFAIQASQQAAGMSEEIKVTAHGPSSDIGVSLKPKKGGMIEASFVPTESGQYEILAVYNDQNIQGSPFSLGVADPSKCQILGDPPTTLNVAQPKEVIVKTQGAGVGKLTCTFDETSETSTPLIEGEVVEKGSDTFEVELMPKGIGDAVVEFKWAGEFISRSPFRVSICDASKCTVDGEELTSGLGRVGEPVAFTINTKGAGNAKPEVVPRGPTAQYSPEVKEKGDGLYSVSFTPWEVGPHKVDVIFGDAHIPGSPFSMNVTSIDATACSATGRGLKHAIAGKPTSFSILSPEKGLLKKKDGIAVSVTSLHEDAPVDIVDNDDGTYTVTYKASKPGSYVTTVKYFDKHIPGSPFKLSVVPAPDASKCRAYGPALHPNSLHLAETPLDLYVDTKDAGSGELQVVIKGPDDSMPKVYTAKDKGVYSLKFDVPKPGRYYAHIWWSQVYIPGSPFKIRVHQGPKAGNVRAYGPGLEEGVKVGDMGEFVVETKNAGIGTLTIRVHGVKDAFKIEANPQSESDPRTLVGHYNPKEGGEYVAAIRWSGVHVPGSPFTIRITNPEKPKKEKKEKASKTSLVLPDNVEANGVPLEGGIPVMTREQAKAYQHRLLTSQRLAQQGFIHPGMSPAYVASGGAFGMQRKLRDNPTMGAISGGEKVSPKKEAVKKTKTKKVHREVLLEEETAQMTIDDSPTRGSKKKRKHKF